VWRHSAANAEDNLLIPLNTKTSISETDVGPPEEALKVLRIEAKRLLGAQKEPGYEDLT
jgi:hypothetical protein